MLTGGGYTGKKFADRERDILGCPVEIAKRWGVEVKNEELLTIETSKAWAQPPQRNHGELRVEQYIMDQETEA